MFEGFDLSYVDAGEATIRVRKGGSGPPLLLLHGHPQTHVMWHRIAPRLAHEFTVVAMDLRGYGESSKPPTAADHEPYSKRAMARDAVAVMRHFGFERFDVAQPYPFPETLIGANPAAFFSGRPNRASVHAPEALEDYLRCYRNPETIHAACEDYRAAATYDFALDEADRGKKKIAAPLLALWAEQGQVGKWYDVLAVWRDWADDVRGHAIDAGHFMPEEAPLETYDALREFFGTP